MTSMLRSALDHGTGYPARARGFTLPAAGKTGTMDEYMDAWFVGFVPSLAAGVWVGYDDKRVIGPGMTGARAALPIWADFMMEATRGRPVEDFPEPAGIVSRLVCTESGMLATDACPHVTNEDYSAGSEPTEYCAQHPGAPLEPTSPESVPPPDEAPPPGTPAAPAYPPR
jgi:membrane carboxypeptidase/penicillin-binding protein